MIVSGRQQRDSVIHIHVSILPQTPSTCGFCVSHFSHMHNIFKTHLFCSTNQYFTWFYVWIIFHCMDKPHFVYSLITSGWISDCFYFFDAINNTPCTFIMLLCRYIFNFVSIYPGVKFLGHVINFCLIFEELSNCFLWWMYHFIVLFF